MFDLQSISKAIAGGLVAAIVALAARYGFHANGETITALGVVVTAVVGYAIGHIVVFFSPPNKVKK